MTADERVAEMIARKALTNASDEHLRTCTEVVVMHPEATDGTYGCDTGCEYVSLDADLSCPHGHSESFHYGEFGDIAMLLEDMR